jgi:hypothetical protein
MKETVRIKNGAELWEPASAEGRYEPNDDDNVVYVFTSDFILLQCQ